MAGASTENEPTSETCSCHRDDKDAETRWCWNSELSAEIPGVGTDSHVSHLLCKAKGKGAELTEIPTLDRSLPGLLDGCAMLLGGDHGDHCFRFHAKMHFSSPHECKELLHHCPMIQIARMGCTKDRRDLLKKMTMSKLNERVRTMQSSSVIVVHDRTSLEQRKAHLVPNAIDMSSITLAPEGKLLCRSDGGDEQVEVDVEFFGKIAASGT